MKSFSKTINGVKYKGEMFEELDIINKFNLSNDKWELIDKYQKTFPQLLLKDTNDFVIDGETLCKELGVKDDFNSWLLRKTSGKQGKLIKYKCVENADFVCLLEKSKTQRKDGQLGAKVKNKISLTLNCAKKIAMRQNNENGDLVCDYFILMENILKEYEKWSLVREPEKCGANDMRQAIKQWCERNNMDSTIQLFYTREFNMLNENLTGFKAVDIRDLKHISDNKTRDNLDIEVNKALHMLQFTNIALLNSDIGFDIRSEIIKKTCNSTYKNIKEEFLKG